MRRQREKQKRGQQTGPREKVMREVTVPDTITIQELANRMTERAVDVVKFLMEQGQMLKAGRHYRRRYGAIDCRGNGSHGCPRFRS